MEMIKRGDTIQFSEEGFKFLRMMGWDKLFGSTVTVREGVNSPQLYVISNNCEKKIILYPGTYSMFVPEFQFEDEYVYTMFV